MSDGADIAIRPATVADADGIFAMLRGLSESVGDSDKMVSSVDDIRQHGFGDAPLFEALVAERAGSIVGLSLYFYSFSTWLGCPGVYIQDLYIDTTARGAGVGRRLVSATARVAKSRGATHLRLSVYDDNHDAQAFYRQIGMRHRDDELIFQADGQTFDALCEAGGPA